jgi:hypothetical protein
LLIERASEVLPFVHDLSRANIVPNRRSRGAEADPRSGQVGKCFLRLSHFPIPQMIKAVIGIEVMRIFLQSIPTVQSDGFSYLTCKLPHSKWLYNTAGHH